MEKPAGWASEVQCAQCMRTQTTVLLLLLLFGSTCRAHLVHSDFQQICSLGSSFSNVSTVFEVSPRFKPELILHCSSELWLRCFKQYVYSSALDIVSHLLTVKNYRS